MHILLLSAYDANSHRYWRESLVTYFGQHYPEIRWTVLTLPARHFNWRIRGNGLYWSMKCREALASCDLVLATSMVDLSTLKGLVPTLANTPSLLYFHENQFAFPISQAGVQAHQRGQADAVAAMMVQLYAALAADRLLFNSHYNQESFFAGLADLLKKLPDYIPPKVVESLQAKSKVLHVPVSFPLKKIAPKEITIKETALKESKQTRSVVWNHRWEYDKGPDRLLACIEAIPESTECTFHIVGQSFRQTPAEFESIRELLNARQWLGHWGYIADESDYQHLLRDASCVLSTAIHDFQGLSVLEAVEQQCIPVVPDRLAYRELFTAAYRYKTDDSPVQEGKNAAEQLLSMWSDPLSVPELCDLHWSVLGPQYLAEIEQIFNSSTLGN